MSESPPAFASVGKDVTELFSEGFLKGCFNIKTTSTSVGLKVTSIIRSHEHEVEEGFQTTFSSLQASTNCDQYEFSGRWADGQEGGFHVKLPKLGENGDFIVELDSAVTANGDIQGTFKGTVCKSVINANLTATHTTNDIPKLQADIVLGQSQGWLAGWKHCMDMKTLAVEDNFCVGFTRGNKTILSTASKDEITASVLAKIDDKLHIAAQVSQAVTPRKQFNFGLAAKYCPDERTVIKAKINNCSQFGISLQHKVKPYLTFTFASLIQPSDFKPWRTLGMGIELEL